MNYYTLTATLCNDEKLVYKNLTEQAIEDLRKIIWVQGLKKKVNHVTFELIDPLTIRRVIIQQQSEFITETQ
jgi:hypothetical protein